MALLPTSASCDQILPFHSQVTLNGILRSSKNSVLALKALLRDAQQRWWNRLRMRTSRNSSIATSNIWRVSTRLGAQLRIHIAYISMPKMLVGGNVNQRYSFFFFFYTQIDIFLESRRRSCAEKSEMNSCGFNTQNMTSFSKLSIFPAATVRIVKIMDRVPQQSEQSNTKNKKTIHYGIRGSQLIAPTMYAFILIH